LYNILLAIYTIFLSKISNQETIVVGTPIAGRSHADLDMIIGMFVDTLALKNEPRGEKRFYTFLAEVNDKTLNAFSNQDFSYEELVEKVISNRDTSRNPLFDTMLVLQNMEIPTLEIPGLRLKPIQFDRSISKFDLTLLCTEHNGELDCIFEYSTLLFKPETIRRFSGYFTRLTAIASEAGDQEIATMEILSPEEKRQLVTLFNDTVESFPIDKTVYQLIEEQVDRIPDHIALVALAGQITNDKLQITNQSQSGGVITYNELNQKANRLAHCLCKKKGILPGQPVAVIMERSIELIISLIGVMKAGGAYVPLDPSLPADRLRVIFNDATIVVVISQQKFAAKLIQLQTQCHKVYSLLITDEPESIIHKQPAVRPDSPGAGHPAYVMYTSGSSGTPKGVLVEHRTIVNTLIWRKNYYDYQPGAVSLRNPPYYFDSSVTDIFTPLLGGACLVLLPEEKKTDLGVLNHVIPLFNVSHFIAVPAFYNVMLEEIHQSLIHVKLICVAGEHFPDELIRKHFAKLPHVRIFNEYGPTENSVNSTAYEITIDSHSAFIGSPISNVSVFILNRHLFLNPIGVTGEICLAGSSLSRGYLNNPQLTHDKFIFADSVTNKVYRTGDMGRWIEDGNLEFMGRLDNQVKIRGIRVETGEIENHLMENDGVKEVVVLPLERPDNEKYLCAYVVPSVKNIKCLDSGFAPGLKTWLSTQLPEYMIPSYILTLEHIPFTSNGKVDRKALPVPDVIEENGYTPPGNETEHRLV
ncbi:MAG: amino acid adenylation domain-containing protein, partial [bacterium]|nr:amino acid adenylation domain-containing protein [bacterium]